MRGDEERLRRLLGGRDTSWIVERARTRLTRGQPLSGVITLTGASEAQRVAVGRLLGRTVSSGQSVSLSLERLDSVLRASGAWPDGLASAVVALGGAVESPRRRRAEEEAWRAVATELAALAERHPEVATWIDGVRSRGHLRRVAQDVDEAMAFIRDLGTVLDALPAGGESTASFSARILHRAHALDAGTAFGGLAASIADALGRGLSTARRDPQGHDSGQARSGSAAWRRAAWASVGVLVDDLSSTVLTLSLPGSASSSHGTGSGTAVALAQLTAHGQPAVLTLRQVVADPLGAIPSTVYVCENPAVVSAAADGLGSRSAPLVCLQGQPGGAAVALLKRLRAGGATLRYRGDFDWAGVTIARRLAAEVDWLPWRFRATDYLEALKRLGPSASVAKLSGPPVATAWDPQLSAVMAQHGVRIEEELVLDELLAHLAGG